MGLTPAGRAIARLAIVLAWAPLGSAGAADASQPTQAAGATDAGEPTDAAGAARRLTVIADPPVVAAGGGPIQLSIEGSRHPAANLRLAVSEGHIEADGPGRFRLHLPEGNAPRAIAVLADDGDIAGATFVRVIGRTDLPVRTRPGSTVAVTVGTQEFGPHEAPEGEVIVPVEVPPGVRAATLSVTDSLGNAASTQVDLNVPAHPRLAALVRTGAVLAGESVLILAALADREGRGAAAARLVVDGSGRAPAAISPLGEGLFALQYRPSGSAGDDSAVVRVDGDPEAGAIALPFQVAVGPPAGIDLWVVDGPRRPGAPVTATAAVRDAGGNILPDAPVRATLDGAPVRVEPGSEGAQIETTLPLRVRPGTRVMIEARSGSAVTRHALTMRPGPPQTAHIRVHRAPRHARIVATLLDAHGNPADARGVSARAEQAEIIDEAISEGRLDARIVPDGRTRVARVEIEFEGRILASEDLQFDPAPEAWMLEGWLAAGGGGELPRLAVGAGLARGRGALGLRLRVGLEHGQSIPIPDIAAFLPALPGDAHLAVTSLPATLLARWSVTGRLGLGLLGGIGPARWRTDVPGMGEAPPLSTFGRAVVGRAGVTADLRIGEGRLAIEATLGHGRIEAGPLTGHPLEGAALRLVWWGWLAELG